MGTLKDATDKNTDTTNTTDDEGRTRAKNPNPSVVISMVHALVTHMRTHRLQSASIKSIIGIYTDEMTAEDMDFDAQPDPADDSEESE